VNLEKNVGKCPNEEFMSNIYRNDALDVLRIKQNEKLANISDEELVSFSQKEIDNFRFSCHWVCDKCNNKIKYKDSLEKNDEKYIHELKCYEVSQDIKCRTPMKLIHNKNYDFNSVYFEELLARYQDRIIAEAMKCKAIEDPYEVYSIILGFFMKIVGKFARDEVLLKTSDKWFSTYFWVSIRNKTTDLRKSNNYIKRTPSVICEVCGQIVGQINSRHLIENGHDELLNKIKYNLGIRILKNSGEIYYYKNSQDEITERAIHLGDESIKLMDKRNEFLSHELYKTYAELYPNSLMKNTMTSLNEIINSNESEHVELGDLVPCEKSIFYNKPDSNLLFIDNIVKKFVLSNLSKLNDYFEHNISYNRRIEIIRKILIEKSSYTNLLDREVDSDFKGEIKAGLTATILKIINSAKDAERKMQKIAI
jgi:hypothetical protein